MDRSISNVERIMALTLVQESEVKIAQGVEFIPLLGDELATATTTVKIPFDSGEDERQEVADNGGDNPETSSR